MAVAGTPGGLGLPVTDDVSLVADPVDDTKQVRIDAGAVTTGTVRVLSMPDQDVNLDPASGSFPPATHASQHQNGGSDEVATATPGANAIPKAGGAGTLAAGWVPDGADATAIHDDTAGEINAISEKGTPVSGDWLLIEDSADSNNKKKVQVGNLPTGGGGEANTASNGGTGGVGIVLTKVGIDLPFKSINVGSNKLSVTDDAVNKNVDLDVVEANVVHDNLSGAGSNTHAQIDSHLASTANPHATDVGNLGSGTLAELNTAITDATLDDSGDPRDPNAHASSHQNGGSDEVATATPGANAIPKAGVGGTLAAGWVPDGADGSAIHDDVAGEINAVAEKGSPVSADLLLIEDSADSNNKKRVQIGNLPTGSSLPVDDTTSIVQDPVDQTKEMRIDVGAVSTATVRVLTMPDQDVDLTPNTGTFPAAAHATRHENGGADEVAHQDLNGAGTNTHAQIDTHISSTANPHATDLGNIGSGTLAELNAAVTDATLDDSSSSRTPTAHAASHQNGGSDEVATATPAANAIPKAGAGGTLSPAWVLPVVDTTSLVEDGVDATKEMRIDVGNISTATVRVLTMPDQDVDLTPNTGTFPAATHATRHENGGADEISVAGLSGLLADDQNPTAHASDHEPGGGDAMSVDAVAGTGSLRTLGTGAQQACAGNDARLSDARTPTSHASSHEPGGGDTMAVDAIAGTGSLRTLGTGAQQACAGNDSRLSDARTPTSHASSHQHGGSDEVATATPGANVIPKTGAGSTLAAGFIPDGADATAIHDNVAGEISAISEKGSPVSGDLLIIEDSGDSNNKKRVQIGNLPTGSSLPVDDTTSIVQDPVDNTKEMRIDVGAVSTATVRVLTMPDQDVDLTPNTGTFPAAAHATRHENGGADEVAHQDLNGAGTNTHAQIDTHISSTANPHSTDLGNIGSGTLAELNTAVTDATLDDSGDPRDPNSHASSHQHGGSDEVATATPGANAIPKAGSGGTLSPAWVLPVVDTTSLVEDGVDPTKEMRIDVGNISTATVRVLTMPDQNIDLTPDTGSFAAATHATRHEPGGGDAMSVDAVAGTGSLRTLGTGAQQACAGNDSRLSDARTPTSHASTHQNGGSDEVATATPGANAIPKADGTGALAAGWVPAGADGSAIHDDTAGEISAITEKGSPVSGDLLLIEDSADSNNKKRVQIGNLPGSQTLPVVDSTSIVKDVGDDTKQMRIDVGAVSASTVRVLTMPDQDVDLTPNSGTFPAATHASRHQHGGADEVATATPAANVIPKADGAGALAAGFIPDGGDATAIHDNVAGEINAIAEKASPVSGDWLILEDSADSNNKKKVQIGNLPSGAALPVDDTTSIVQDPVDNTKQMRIDVGAVTTATVRVLTMPDQDVDLTPNTGTFPAASHASRHQHGGADEVATATPAANAIPKADATGDLAAGWIPDGGDATAIHDNVSAEISAVTEKTAPVAADLLLIEDSEASNAKKRLQIGNLPNYDTFSFKVTGKLAVQTDVDGAWIAPRACTITRVTLFRRTAGTSGSTTVDVNKNGTTIYTTQANRPTVAQTSGNDATDATTDMDVTSVAQDDRIECDIDAIEAGNVQDITVVVEVEY
jgi:hypothetical protein